MGKPAFRKNFPRKFSFFAIGILLVAVLFTTITIQQRLHTHSLAASSGPLHVHPANPRYLTDGSGRAIVLTGIEAELNVVGTSDYIAYLNHLQSKGHNFTRLWGWHNEIAAIKYDNDPNLYHNDSLPWTRTGPCCALDNNPKFNLTTDKSHLNEAYFTRLRDITAAAQARGIVVEVILLDGWWTHRHSEQTRADRWSRSPFNPDNNINGISGTIDTIHTLTDPAVTSAYKAYIEKVIDTLNPYDNVIYEISNEDAFTAANREWQEHLIAHIRSYQSTNYPSRQQLILRSQQYGESSATLFTSSAEVVSPNVSADSYSTNPPANDGSKVIVADTDHGCANSTDVNGCGGVRWAWKSFMRGLHPLVYYEPYTQDSSDGEGFRVQNTLGVIRDYANTRIDLVNMVPQNGGTTPASTGYSLSKPGEYLVLQPGSGSFTVLMTAGTYTIQWLNADTGAESTGSQVTSDGNTAISFNPPYTKSVLWAKSSDASSLTPLSTATPTPSPAVSVSPTGASRSKRTKRDAKLAGGDSADA
jgi:hypothetical protein